MTTTPSSAPPVLLPPAPHVGAFVLETLTLGMYGEPRHTLREYVQNAFDAIRSAKRLKVLADRGQVELTFGADAIAIRDNGTGVSASQAWRTLTSVGASKKDRQRDAGFRGIGRLAGMAYCDTLLFRTTFQGETTLTTLSFDCKALLKAMNPDDGGDVELSKLLGASITFTQQEQDAAADDHFFEVRMEGLSTAPASLKSVDEVRDYLSETAPVEFDPEWGRGADIAKAYHAFFGAPIETIDVLVTAGEVSHRVYKAYGETYDHAKGSANLTRIEFREDDNNRFWGWVGHVDESAAITTPQTQGLRVRVRNIQVDGTELFGGMFGEHKQSYQRFATYYVGEFHIVPDKVVPNARRDGFEENEAWLEIRRSLVKDVCAPLALQAYKASEAAKTVVTRVVGQVDTLVESGRKLTSNTRSTFEQVVDVLANAKKLRRTTAAALKTVGDVDDALLDQGDGASASRAALQEASRNVDGVEAQARMLLGRYLDDDEKMSGLRARIRQEVVNEVLEVVSAHVEPAVYQTIRRRLLAMA